jgi:hypothetical protein
VKKALDDLQACGLLTNTRVFPYHFGPSPELRKEVQAYQRAGGPGAARADREVDPGTAEGAALHRQPQPPRTLPSHIKTL